MESKKLLFYCEKKKLYGVANVEKVDGAYKITDFFGLREKEINVEKQEFTTPPEVNDNLLPCSKCGKRKPLCCDKSSTCGSLTTLAHQCLYCNKLAIARPALSKGPFDIYFLLDQSGSMSKIDRQEASKAVQKLMQSMGPDNLYSFVAWATDATYLFKHEKKVSKIIDALKKYEDGKTGISGRTCIEEGFKLISRDVKKSQYDVVIIVVTDGGFDNKKLAVTERNNLLAKNEKANIVAIGITGAKQENLNSICTIEEFSKVLESSSGLESTFLSIGEILKTGNYNTK